MCCVTRLEMIIRNKAKRINKKVAGVKTLKGFK